MATPAIVQHKKTSSSLSAVLPVNGFFRLRMKEPTQAGNCLIVTFQGGGSVTSIAVSDDQGNTYIAGPVGGPDGNAQSLWIFYALNVAAGTRLIRIKNTSSIDINYVQGTGTEVMNIATSAAADGSNASFGTGTTVTAGSFTPGTSGDFILQAMICDNPVVTTAIVAGSQANISWALRSADVHDGNAVQWGVYNSTAAINPTMSQGTSTGWISAAIALKSASAGAPAAGGIRVVGGYAMSMPSQGTSMTGAVGISNPTTIQVPCVGTVLAACVSSGSTNLAITSITDNLGNSWSEFGSGASVSNIDPNKRDNCHVWFAPLVVAGQTLTLTVTWGSVASNDATIYFYDIAGADLAQPATASNGVVGDQTVAAATIDTTILTPDAQNGLVLMLVQQEFNTEDGITLAGALFDSTEYDGMPVDGPQNMDQNGGWAHYYPGADLSNILATWTLVADTGDPMRQYAAYAVLFTASSVLSAFVGEPKCGHGILSA